MLEPLPYQEGKAQKSSWILLAKIESTVISIIVVYPFIEAFINGPWLLTFRIYESISIILFSIIGLHQLFYSIYKLAKEKQRSFRAYTSISIGYIVLLFILFSSPSILGGRIEEIILCILLVIPAFLSWWYTTLRIRAAKDRVENSAIDPETVLDFFE